LAKSLQLELELELELTETESQRFSFAGLNSQQAPRSLHGALT